MFDKNNKLDYEAFNKEFPVKTQETLMLHQILMALETIRCGLIDVEEEVKKLNPMSNLPKFTGHIGE